MTQLISKAQYKRSEEGEFHEISARDLKGTISLIQNYPWDTERSLASIELTCPSITLEHPIGTYLKVGPYFSGKFSLYYLDTNNKVYLKTVNTIEDCIVFIKAYFEQQGKIRGFEKYGFTINAAAHFKTNPFEYTINTKAIVKFFLFPIYMTPLILLICLLKYIERPQSLNLGGIVVMILFLPVFCSGLIYLFFNYRSAEKNSYLQISKGHDDFLYGTVDNKKLYYKHNIAEINSFGIPYTRTPWSECEIFFITFKNDEQIKFTSLLISGDQLRKKLPDHQIKVNKNYFPTFESV